MGGRIIGPCPTGASAAGRSPSEKDKGPARAGAFVRRIASASTRLRRRPAFRALSLKKKGSGQIDSPSTRTIGSAHVRTPVTDALLVCTPLLEKKKQYDN